MWLFFYHFQTFLSIFAFSILTMMWAYVQFPLCSRYLVLVKLAQSVNRRFHQSRCFQLLLLQTVFRVTLGHLWAPWSGEPRLCLDLGSPQSLRSLSACFSLFSWDSRNVLPVSFNGVPAFTRTFSTASHSFSSVLLCVCVLSHQVVSDSLRPHGL